MQTLRKRKDTVEAKDATRHKKARVVVDDNDSDSESETSMDDEPLHTAHDKLEPATSVLATGGVVAMEDEKWHPDQQVSSDSGQDVKQQVLHVTASSLIQDRFMDQEQKRDAPVDEQRTERSCTRPECVRVKNRCAELEQQLGRERQRGVLLSAFGSESQQILPLRTASVGSDHEVGVKLEISDPDEPLALTLAQQYRRDVELKVQALRTGQVAHRRLPSSFDPAAFYQMSPAVAAVLPQRLRGTKRQQDMPDIRHVSGPLPAGGIEAFRAHLVMFCVWFGMRLLWSHTCS